MAADHREIGHAHHLLPSFLNEGELTYFFDVTRPFGFHLQEEVLVNFKNDLQMAGEHFMEESNAPFFQCLGQQCVVRVGKSPRDNSPSPFPTHSIHVMQETLKLDYGDCRMGIVQLNGDFLRKIGPILVISAESTDDILQGTGNEEILLDQAKLLAAFGLVIGIENLGNGLAEIFLPYSFLITSVVECFEIKLLRGLGLPEAQKIDRVGPVSRNGNIVGNPGEFFGVCPFGNIVA